MHLSTSSSDERLPSLKWFRLFASATIVFVAFVSAMELRLAARGFRASVTDSEALWLKQRARASHLGNKALIVVGASRIQLDVDLDALRQLSGLEPVQLAIDGSTSLPILEGLISDPTITGTIVFDYYDHIIADPEIHDLAERYQKDYESYTENDSTGTDIESWLSDYLHAHLRSYSDGASPFNSLMMRIVPAQAIPQYLVTLPDRSRVADYTEVPMPQFYYARVMRELGQTIDSVPGATYGDLDRQLRQRIDRIKPADNGVFLREISVFRKYVEKLEQRGGRIAFVRMPSSGLVSNIEKRRFPPELFWNKFSEGVGAPVIGAEKYPALGAFRCPDGSHLDYRDRQRFTRALVDALGSEKVIKGR